MFAVIKTGGKQYKVAANDVIRVETVPGEPGEAVSFAEVLLVGDESSSTLGSPLVEGASVSAEIVAQTRGPKVIAFKKRRRQNSKRTRGHRQHLTEVRITEILAEGKKTTRTRAKKAAAEATTEAPAAEAAVGA
jgi:large subunit ribosomal protein L21